MICTDCKLHETRRCIVEPLTLSTPLLFITEGPSFTGEIKNEFLSLHEHQFLNKLVSSASALIESDPILFNVIGVVLCRPTNNSVDPNRLPALEEVLACGKNVTDRIKKINPKAIIFTSKIVAKYYGREYSGSTTILPIGFLIDQGGPTSSWYPQTVRIISEVIKEINAQA